MVFSPSRINRLLSALSALPDCKVYPPTTLPEVRSDLVLPDDLRYFYQCCGGCSLYSSTAYPVEVVPPERFKSANLQIIGEEVLDDITHSWSIICLGRSGEAISIDLHPHRLGTCYDSFWDCHGVPGDCAVIAASFSDLIERLLSNHGQYWYWLKDDFISMGDAYDEPRHKGGRRSDHE